MTKMDWSRARRWRSTESISRPIVATERMQAFDRGGSARRRPSQGKLWLALDLSQAAQGSPAHLARFGFNMLAAWCPVCRAVERMPFKDLRADHLGLAGEDLGRALSCPDCNGPRAVTPIAERVVRRE